MNSILKKLLPLFLTAVLVLTSMTGLAVVSASAEEAEITFVQKSLVAWYDGVDNEANGTHNNDAKVWQNKANPTEDWAIHLVTDANDHFTDEGFAIHDDRQFFPKSVVDIINGEAWTMEITLGDFVGLGGTYHTFINCDNDNFSLFIRVATGCLEFKYAGLTRENRYELQDGVELIKNSTITISYEPGGMMTTYIDGEEVDCRAVNDFMGADNLFFGHNKTDRNQDTTFKSIRIYDRILTEEEVAYNCAVTDGTATEPFEKETEVPTEPVTDAPTDAPTEPVTDTPTEPVTDAPTDVPTDLPADPTADGGCNSVIGFGAVAVLVATAAAIVSRKGKDE